MSVKSTFRFILVNMGILIGTLLLYFLFIEIGIRIVYGNPHIFRSPQVRHIQTSYGYKPAVNFFWASDGSPAYIKHFRNFAESKGIVYVDLLEKLQMMQDENLYYMYPWDNHLNPKGHRRVTDQLLNVIKDTLNQWAVYDLVCI